LFDACLQGISKISSVYSFVHPLCQTLEQRLCQQLLKLYFGFEKCGNCCNEWILGADFSFAYKIAPLQLRHELLTRHFNVHDERHLPLIVSTNDDNGW
jgi:hypothetical protein